MRYFLLYRKGEYFILKSSRLGIIATAIARACTPLASVYSSNEQIAIKILFAAALSHHQNQLSKSPQSKN